MRNRSWPRASRSGVTGCGKRIAQAPCSRPAYSRLSVRASPRATVPAGGRRMARPSAKSGLAFCALNFGCLSMSGMIWMRGFGDGEARSLAMIASGTSPSTASTISTLMITRGIGSLLHGLDGAAAEGGQEIPRRPGRRTGGRAPR